MAWLRQRARSLAHAVTTMTFPRSVGSGNHCRRSPPQRRTSRSSREVRGTGLGVFSASCAARRSRSLPRRNSSSVRVRIVESARRKVSAWARNAVYPPGARPVGPARKPLADEHGSAGAENAADLARGGFEVGDVVDHGGQPRAVRSADVRHGHPGHRVEVTSYRVTPVPEPVSRDLTYRFERCRGLVVVGDPGHVVPPDWYCSPPEAVARLYPVGRTRSSARSRPAHGAVSDKVANAEAMAARPNVGNICSVVHGQQNRSGS